MIIQQRDKYLLDDLGDKIEHMRKAQKFSILRLCTQARMRSNTVKTLLYGRGGLIVSLMRVVDACGYELVFIKRNPVKRLKDIEGGETKLYKLKKIQSDAKKRERE